MGLISGSFQSRQTYHTTNLLQIKLFIGVQSNSIRLTFIYFSYYILQSNHGHQTGLITKKIVRCRSTHSHLTDLADREEKDAEISEIYPPQHGHGHGHSHGGQALPLVLGKWGYSCAFKDRRSYITRFVFI